MPQRLFEDRFVEGKYKTKRVKAGTQEEVGRRAGVNRKTVGRGERGLKVNWKTGVLLAYERNLIDWSIDPDGPEMKKVLRHFRLVDRGGWPKGWRSFEENPRPPRKRKLVVVKSDEPVEDEVAA